ncbi:hypothetical protein GCM10017688_22810 [Streptomyces ramulosus]
MRGAAADEEIGGDQGAETKDGQRPQGQGNVHCSSGRVVRHITASWLPEVSSARCPKATGPTPRDLVTLVIRDDGDVVAGILPSAEQE